MKDLHELYPNFPAEFPLPFILDGATGTALMKRGMPSGACTEEWVLENPDALREVQRGYRENGSDAVYAPTFGANAPTLSRHKIKENVAELNKRLAALSVEPGRLTGGDLSPTGLFIEPYGDTPFDDVVDIYAEQAKGLCEAGVDFFIAETMINLNELRAAVMGVRSVSDKPIFATLTVDERGRTMSGDSLEAAFVVLAGLASPADNEDHGDRIDLVVNERCERIDYVALAGVLHVNDRHPAGGQMISRRQCSRIAFIGRDDVMLRVNAIGVGKIIAQCLQL